MMNKPAWLPEMLEVNPWTGDTYESLYQLFCDTLKDVRLVYRGSKVWFFPEIEDGKEKIFWHLTSRDDKEAGERLPDLRRSERLPWVRPMLDWPDRAEILDWDFEEADGTIKTYVWLKDHDFVVIMKKFPDETRRLITSFWIEYNNTRRKMQKKHDNRLR